ncbi:high-affinity zinc uptake system protein ZNUA [Citreicella sp. 357]|nr:high-affinity zinc uptake system protein ZNUA [Citreicella sp. 357]
MHLPLSVVTALMGGAALAEVPRVAVDIAPVHSLVARVMEGVGSPYLIVQSGASPHEYSLRPSEATALQEADVVFWVSPELTPWLGDAIETLATNASVSELLEADGTIELEFREGALFEAHEHGENEHGENGHEEHADDDEHAEHDAHEGHDHGGHDPHAWLSPQNAATWLNVIAGQLSAADPENAGAYFANAAAGQEEIDALIGEVTAVLEPVRGGQFIVFHDAYQYFENAFDFPASGAISISDASDPSPARISEIQHRISGEGITCVMSEPQFNRGIVAAVLDGMEADTAVLDPLGSDLEPGPTLYPQLIRNLASTLAECL